MTMLLIFLRTAAMILIFYIGSSVTDERDKNSRTILYENNMGENGLYEYSFSTDNSIFQSQSSKKKEDDGTSGLEVTGKYFYVSPDEYLVNVEYTGNSYSFYLIKQKEGAGFPAGAGFLAPAGPGFLAPAGAGFLAPAGPSYRLSFVQHLSSTALGSLLGGGIG